MAFTAKTVTFSHAVHVLLFVISCSQVETIVQIQFFHMLEWNHVLLLKTEDRVVFEKCPNSVLTFLGTCPTVGKEK